MIFQPLADAVTTVQFVTALITALTASVVALVGLVVAFKRLRKELADLRADQKLIKSVVTTIADSPGSPEASQATATLAADPAEVGRWATEHGASNAWNMGPRNWEKALFDLGVKGGKDHPLEHLADGTLKYQ